MARSPASSGRSRLTAAILPARGCPRGPPPGRPSRSAGAPARRCARGRRRGRRGRPAPAGAVRRRRAGSQRKPEGPQLGGDRVVADDDRPAVDGRFERGDAEALPRRGVEHGVGRGVRGGPLVVGERRPQDAGPSRRPAPRRGWARSPPRPARAASTSRRPRSARRERAGARPCARWRGPGAAAAARRRVDAQAVPQRGAVARPRGVVELEGVVDDVGVDAPLGQLGGGEAADGDVAPRRVVGRQLGDVGEAGPVPGRVVVVEERGAARAARRRRPVTRAG